MKRAEISKNPFASTRPWYVDLNRRGPSMDVLIESTGHPTHHQAMTYALEAVGLGVPIESREAP